MGVTQYTFSAEQWERVLMSSAATRTSCVFMSAEEQASTGHTEPSTGHTESSTGHTESSTGHTEPSTGHTEPSTGHTEDYILLDFIIMLLVSSFPECMHGGLTN